MGAASPHRESSKDRKPRFHCSNSAHCAHLLSSSTQADVDVPFNPRPERRRRRCAVTSDRPCSTSLSIEAAPVTRPRRRGAKPDPASTPAKVREDKTRRSKYIADRHPLEDDSLHAPVRADRLPGRRAFGSRAGRIECRVRATFRAAPPHSTTFGVSTSEMA